MDEKWKNGEMDGWIYDHFDGWMPAWRNSTMDGLIAGMMGRMGSTMDGWMDDGPVDAVMEGWILLGYVSICCSILLSSQEQQQRNIDRETVAFHCFHPEMTAVVFFSLLVVKIKAESFSLHISCCWRVW